ncbi:MAG: hypothetical protein LBQ61_05610, partial [Spirochaetales bacterium]|nr:hypothetical protein [Spirochaetales bacterium]
SFLFLLLILWGLSGLAAQSAGSRGDVYVGIVSFDQTIHDLTGGRPLLLDQANYAELLRIIDRDYNRAGPADQGTSLYYAVHNALANITANAPGYPDNLSTVNILTFTDGLDNNSTNPNLDPLENQDFAGRRVSEYQTYLRTELARRRVNDNPINAYAVGVQGRDVTDANQFRTSIETIASSPARAYFQSDFSKLVSVFNGIAADLYQETTNVTFNMLTPAFAVGTRIRMTFDVAANNNEASAAAGSQNYLEGEIIGFANRRYQLGNITYHGTVASTSGTVVYGDLDQQGVTYTFGGFQGFDPNDARSLQNIKQWSMAEGSRIWQPNSEYNIDPRTATSVESTSTVIYLVLDSSNSMDDEGIRSVREAVKEFIRIFYTGEVTASLPRPAASAPAAAPEPGEPAQAKFSLYVDAAPLVEGLAGGGAGIGIGFRTAVNRVFVDSELNFVFSTDEFSFAMDYNLLACWYLMGGEGKLFIGTALGLGTWSGLTTLSAFVLNFGVEAGWTFNFGSFWLEPWLGAVTHLGFIEDSNSPDPAYVDIVNRNAFKIGVRAGLAL